MNSEPSQPVFTYAHQFTIISLSKLPTTRTLHFPMFAFVKAQRPTASFVKAQETHAALDRYLVSSTDPTEIFLQRAMSMTEEVSSLWSVAQARGTGGHLTKHSGERRSASLVQLLTWLSSGGQDSSESEELQLAIEAAVKMGGKLAALTLQSLAVDSAKEPDVPATAPENRPRPYAVRVKTIGHGEDGTSANVRRRVRDFA
jgi:hypothetical protein